MKVFTRRLLIVALLLTAALQARAQFVLTGDDPGYLKWYSMETQYYKIIYPQGADSLARNYGTMLEKVRPAIGLSLGYTPGEGQKKMPVVLHTHNPYSNGSVAWAPKRMDLYTLPDAYGSDPTPWDVQLVTHEPRHQAQLELDRHGFWRGMSYVVGQIWTPALFQMYIALCLGEGDAVTVETGLAPGTRARTADFLNYYQVALDAGDYRSWYRWRYGSFKTFTPDHYKIGYITVAGPRAMFHDPLVMASALEKSRRNKFILNTLNLRKVVQDHTGLKFKEAFPQILNYFNATWQKSAAERAPFNHMEQLTDKEDFAVDYATPTELDGRIYLLRKGYVYTAQLGCWENGEFHALMPFASHTSSLYADTVRHRIYWSETMRDPRWSLSGKSIVRYYEPGTGKVKDLTTTGRLYNPQPSPDGSRLSVVEYPHNGGSSVEIISADDGSVLERFISPDGVQASETAWIGETLYVSGVSIKGYGIYAIGPDGNWRTVLEPSIQKLVNLGAQNGSLSWVSDLDGVNNLYSYNPATGELLRLTSTRFGATDFCEAEGALLGISQTLGGKMLFRLSGLEPKPADFAAVHTYPIEDRITAQERSFGAKVPENVPVSAPKKYSKFGHLMRFHSWLPFYFDYDQISSVSLDNFYTAVAPGVTGFFQNTLSTMSGTVGFAVAPDSYDETRWRPSLHAKFTYSGWYPVIEGSIDFGGQDAQELLKVTLTEGGITQYGMASASANMPLLNGHLRAYVPLSFSKGGLSYGFVPQVSYTISNNLYDVNYLDLKVITDNVTGEQTYEQIGPHTAYFIPMQRLAASVRAYVALPRARSQTYPRWGAGIEVGANMRPDSWDVFRPNVYAYLYGYTPGFTRTQGLKLTGMIQHQLRLGQSLVTTGEMTASTLPRGFSALASRNAARLFETQAKVTADYAIPIYVGDLALPPIAYIRNFLAIPHADFTYLTGGHNLFSAGADITAEFGKLIVPFDGSIGVSVSYLGGSAYNAVGQKNHWSFGLIMKYDF